MTDRYAVIGNPVAHSQSPFIHRMFAQALGDDIAYDAILGRAGHFGDDVRAFRRSGGCGLNVTVPFKLDAYALATIRTPRATHAGAVNTLKFEGDQVVGDNTDGAGLVRDVLLRLDFAIEAKRVLLLGAGGAARGAVLALLAERPSCLAIANRTADKARALAMQVSRYSGVTEVAAGPSETFSGRAFDLFINATSASLTGELPSLPKAVFAPGALAYDMVYGDRARPFLAYALAHGAARAVDGLGMLVEQAAESYFLWRGVRPQTAPVLAMLSAAGATGHAIQRRDNGSPVAGMLRTR